jgi:hypothetical protein
MCVCVCVCLRLTRAGFDQAADESIIETLKANGRLFAAAKLKHSYPFCWRSDTPLIYKVPLAKCCVVPLFWGTVLILVLFWCFGDVLFLVVFRCFGGCVLEDVLSLLSLQVSLSMETLSFCCFCLGASDK